MTKKSAAQPKPPERERRTGEDRRKLDLVPPSKAERRRSVESRKPDVVEIEMSNSEWGALTQEPPPPPKR